MKKRALVLTLVAMFVLATLAGCTSTPTASPTPAATPAAGGTEATPATEVTPAVTEMYIPVIGKGFQHQFWQVVKKGSEQAGADLGVKIFFTGPEGESAVNTQVDMISQEMTKNPSAICLAALDTNSVLTQLADLSSKKIPVVGFDSGVPDAPAGQVAANASTNNDNAAAIGAEKMFEMIKDKVTAATVAAPVSIVVLSQDVTSASIQGRTRGFAKKMADLVAPVNAAVAIEGGYKDINQGDAATAAVKIVVVVGATPDITDMTNAANGLLNTANLAGVFCSNEGAVNGLLASVNAGSKIPEGCKVVGFDAGSGQKAAVKAGVFAGSITQDPFQIGYKAVELAVKAAKGETVTDVDTGAKWYDATNMDQADIAQLLYD